MIAAIGLDSFDTAFAGCTTHFASIILHQALREGYEPVDYPWLIRLNPAVPWKTRGNGAVALLLHVDSRSDAERLAQLVRKASRLYATAPEGKAAYVILVLEDAERLEDYMEHRPRCLERLYLRAVHESVPLRLAEKCLRETATLTAGYGGAGSRGLVGSLAALGAVLSDYTFELLAYRRLKNWAKPRRIDEESVIEYDLKTRPYTFMNYDYEEGRVLIAPHGYDPVLYGVRGERPDILLKALDTIEAGEEPSHWTIFRSNQATGAHLRRKPVARVRPYDNPVVEGRIEDVKRLPGGHVLARICDETGCIDTAFYRETGRLRRIVLRLPSGSLVEAGGQAKPHRGRLTLNAEYLCVRETPPVEAGCRAAEYKLLGCYTPPLSSYHHLMPPPGRAPGERRLEPPRTPVASPRINL
ncbi:hypothetical protein CF15_02770 [Pyrodictium occultum]|uniref:tRNA(Ile2) 2-agmatinylcytidine synthetase TiaS n=1 Tax=Pyrodictium occultum TaxID=2309 RepID=A0A0V8RUR3_PYROC|nr:DUF1743 domain-containing protein [Pyrodictium occultum]KSW11752.1 hypothetical protein CF15_02770 [Pyrodictium occultum]